MGNENNKKTLYDRDEILDELSQELMDRFNIEESDTFKTSGLGEGQFFFKETGKNGRIRFAGHYEPGIDILIDDCKLNALGLIYVFCEDDVNKKIKGLCDTFLKNCIDRACYIRHLLIRNAETKNERNRGKNNKRKIQARCVELIIVCPESFKVEFGDTLRDIAQKTDCLQSIGVNLLTFSGPGKKSGKKSKKKRTQESEGNEKYFKERDIQRAFSWLLLNTNGWYQEIKKISSNSNAPLRNITLNNYRLPGKRIIKLDSNRNVHLIHGHNGSGKSTIVEALEIAVTGSSERLGNIPDYDKVIRNIYSEKPANVGLLLEGKEVKEFWIKKKGVSRPMAKEIKATAFRLDQAVMERLTRAGEGERANVFINAFFPKDREVVKKHDAARKEADKYFKELPPNLQDSIRNKRMSREDAVIDALAVLENEKMKKSTELIEACLPLSISSLKKLTPLSPGLSGALESLSSGLLNEEVLTQVDNALREIMGYREKNVYVLQRALELLTRLNKWKVSPKYATDFKTTLDKWMEMTAMTDLVEKYFTVVKSLNEAHKKKWVPDKDSLQIFEQYPFTYNDKIIKEKLKIFTSKRDHLRTLLEPTQFQTVQEAIPESIQPIFDHSEMLILNQAGEWLSYPGLGKRIEEALSKNECTKYNKLLTIGIPNWAKQLIEETEILIGACDEIKNKGVFEKSCVERFKSLNKTLQVYKDLKEIGEKIHTTFLKLLKKEEKGNLIEVLNEIMDLFTPARWAYEDIEVRHEYSNRKHRLHFEIGEPKKGQKVKTRADLRLNSAELNVFALSLFTLCAIRNPNPLSLLIFDDPLQNMDEITVTTLARGFNKLIKLFPENWQIIMLFHGQDDLERIYREIPAAVYSLPWLSPLSEAKLKPIEIEPDILKGHAPTEVQDLNEIVEIKI